jgi:hypothetical protein
MSKLGSLYISLGSPEGELSGGCCEIDGWAADEIERLMKQQSALVEALRHYANGDCLSGHIARAAIAAVKPAASPWRPIETAPQDGTPVDIFADGVRLPDMRRVQLGPENVFYSPVNSGPSCVRDATHWMPLPAAPVKPAGQEGSE